MSRKQPAPPCAQVPAAAASCIAPHLAISVPWLHHTHQPAPHGSIPPARTQGQAQSKARMGFSVMEAGLGPCPAQSRQRV